MMEKDFNFRNVVWFAMILVSAGSVYGMLSQKVASTRREAANNRTSSTTRYSRNKGTSDKIGSNARHIDKSRQQAKRLISAKIFIILRYPQGLCSM